LRSHDDEGISVISVLLGSVLFHEPPLVPAARGGHGHRRGLRGAVDRAAGPKAGCVAFEST